MTALLILLGLMCLLLNSEVFSMFALAFLGLIGAGWLIKVIAEHEPPKMDGTFSSEWGKK